MSKAQDTRDRNRCMNIYGPILTRCFGGRIVVDGFNCPHCDSADPPNECHIPKKGNEKERENESQTS